MTSFLVLSGDTLIFGVKVTLAVAEPLVRSMRPRLVRMVRADWRKHNRKRAYCGYDRRQGLVVCLGRRRFFEEKGLRFPLETATARYTYVALVMDANSELAASFLPGSEDCTKVEEIPPGEPGDN